MINLIVFILSLLPFIIIFYFIGKAFKNSNLNNNFELNFIEDKDAEPYCIVFDTETTGLIKDFQIRPTVANLKNFPNNFPNIVSISWAIFSRDKKLISEGNYLIKQTTEIPIDAVKIHGISTEKANIEGINIIDFITIFIDECNKVQTIIGHNVLFDKYIIESEFIRNGFKKPFTNKKVYDTMKMGQKVLRVNKFPKLEELCIGIFGKNIKEHLNSHNSQMDTFFTAQCFFYMKNKKGYYWS